MLSNSLTRPLFIFFFLLVISSWSTAQYNIEPALLGKAPLELMPLQDNDRLLTDELAQRRPGRALTFAVAQATTIRPTTHGIWVNKGATSTWLLRIKSPGAHSLNLGFSEYNLPQGAALYLSTPEERFGPFTAADNDDHNQLWTPILLGDELLIELQSPTALKENIQLYLTTVNHDFEGVTKSLSGSCNLDVACGADNGWEIVDAYRDQIRSVAAYTLNGINQCTGFLVNNTNEDGRAFFMTANHCRVREDNAAGVVAYWNYENSICRQPGTSASSQNGDGRRNVFNTGSIFRARSAGSDMCLLEFDEAVNPDANAYFSGWDRTATPPTDTVIAIHHPVVQEKRISFSFNQVTPSSTDRGFIVVPAWSIGTTEGGSSGSPLFNRHKRIVGQLYGGTASCSQPQGSDIYGFFPVSWDGGGTPSTSISYWLDPCGLNPLFIDGFDEALTPYTLSATSNCLKICNTDETEFSFRFGSEYPATANVQLITNNTGIIPQMTIREEGGAVFADIELPAGLPPGSYQLTYTVSAAGYSDDITFSIDVSTPQIEAPQTLTPENAAIEVAPYAVFVWEQVANARTYNIQISETDDFSTNFYSEAGLTLPNLQIAIPLRAETRYYWRVRAHNVCGLSPWSAPAPFTVASISCNVTEDSGPPILIPSDAGSVSVIAELGSTSDRVADLEVTVRITHSYVGDLSGELVSPSGTTIQLFDQPRGGACSGENIEVTFTDSAPNTAEDFVNSCDVASEVSISGAYQPAQPLSELDGSPANGTWTLVITDGADFDGGYVEEFAVNFCVPYTGIDYSIRNLNGEVMACLEETPPALRFALGSSYDGSTTVTVSTEAGELNGVSLMVDDVNNHAVVSIADWNDLVAGPYDLYFNFEASDGTGHIITLPVTLSQEAEAAVLIGPANEAILPVGTVDGPEWVRARGAVTYTVEYSANPNFDPALVRDDTGIRTSADLPGELQTGEVIYWRVISNNELCGSAVSEVRSFTFEAASTEDFANGARVAIYPNPARDYLMVDFSGGFGDVLQGKLFDATGRQISAVATVQPGQHRWDLSGLSPGVYVLRLTSGRQQLMERIVVSH